MSTTPPIFLAPIDDRLSPARIRELARLLPPTCDYFKPCTKEQTPPRLANHDRYLRCLMDPKFGWNFSVNFARSGEFLPPDITDPDLRRANYFLAHGERDGLISHVHGLTDPNQTAVRNALHGLLISRDIGYEGIGNWLGIHSEVVRIYAKLMFNVRGRFQERGYIMSLLYPKTRLVEQQKRYPEGVDPGLLLVRAGYNFGCREVLYLSGLSSKRLIEVNGRDAMTEFESAIIDNTRTLVRHGGLNQKDVPGIQHAKALLLEVKRKDQRQTSDDQMFSLAQLNPGTCILDDIKRLVTSDVSYLEEQRAMWVAATGESESDTNAATDLE